ncbi:hypothetical protein QMK19_03425 [Streptomyces sp. H10-C2]|uniref:hypothetical protein n=1 Tax=unclassified Streptomyces TaxID=2593676 RepID=UPI0024B9F047|nr:MULTISPECIES: hypothetical protein [unclassified Streptomyces]MDJ0342237.1 hypothetical protein [Streptomyces sp. PH10-H1]MDJ0368751.1 hypothetical protein [Streptomyces sp. H10-C2]
MPRCDVTDLDTSMCAHCLGHADPEQQAKRVRARLLASGRWFPALYPGTCEHCGERFEPGAAIRLEIPQGWCAECCAESTP